MNYFNCRIHYSLITDPKHLSKTGVCNGKMGVVQSIKLLYCSKTSQAAA